MGLSICVLAILKLMDISSFAESFSKYDLITQRWLGEGLSRRGVTGRLSFDEPAGPSRVRSSLGSQE